MKVKPISDPLEREKLLRIAIGKTISGKMEETPWDLMPPTVRFKAGQRKSYVPPYKPNHKSLSVGMK